MTIMDEKFFSLFNRGRVKRLLIVCLGLPLIMFSSYSCEKKAPARAGRPPAPVRLASASILDAPLEVNAVGTIRPLAVVSVRSRVTGYLEKIHFKAGSEVRAGEPLFSLDKKPFELVLNQAEANLERARVAADKADRESRRYKQLSSSAATAETRDQKAAAAAMAVHDVAAFQAQAAIARQNLDYCSIKAPISGRTGNYLMDRGNLVESYSEPLVVINQIQPIKALFSAPQRTLADIARYSSQGVLKVQAFAPGREDRFEEGALTFINNQINRETGMIDLEATFENRSKRLWPGQFVKIRLLLTMEKNKIQIPYQAVERGPKSYFVFVYKEDGTVEVRDIVRGRRSGDYQIIESGLNGNERVVVDGQINLSPGAKVLVVDDSVRQGEKKAELKDGRGESK